MKLRTMVFAKKLNVILADDNQVFLDGLSFLISTIMGSRVIDTCKDGTELVNSIQLSNADIILIDIEMPKINGICAAKIINQQIPQMPLVAMTMYQEKVFLHDIIGAGFKGFVFKPDTAKTLFDVMTKVMDNQFVFPDNMNI